jgi:hypothetical protein
MSGCISGLGHGPDPFYWCKSHALSLSPTISLIPTHPDLQHTEHHHTLNIITHWTSSHTEHHHTLNIITHRAQSRWAWLDTLWIVTVYQWFSKYLGLVLCLGLLLTAHVWPPRLCGIKSPLHPTQYFLPFVHTRFYKNTIQRCLTRNMSEYVLKWQALEHSFVLCVTGGWLNTMWRAGQRDTLLCCLVRSREPV